MRCTDSKSSERPSETTSRMHAIFPQSVLRTARTSVQWFFFSKSSHCNGLDWGESSLERSKIVSCSETLLNKQIEMGLNYMRCAWDIEVGARLSLRDRAGFTQKKNIKWVHPSVSPQRPFYHIQYLRKAKMTTFWTNGSTLQSLVSG